MRKRRKLYRYICVDVCPVDFKLTEKADLPSLCINGKCVYCGKRSVHEDIEVDSQKKQYVFCARGNRLACD